MKVKLIIIIPLVAQLSIVYCQNQSRPCGPPENIEKLPDFAQDEIKAVWKNYVPGTKCDKELLITDDILAVLDMFDKEVTHSSTATTSSSTGTTLSETLLGVTSPSTLFVPHRETATAIPEAITATDAIKDDTFNSFMPTPEVSSSTDNTQKDYDYFDANPKRTLSRLTTSEDFDNKEPKKVPLYEMETVLPFLEGANRKTIMAFHDLLNDADIPSEGKREELIHLLAVSYLDGDQLRRFNAWSTSRRKRLRARDELLSHRAQDALQELINIDEDDREKALQRLPKKIRQELRNYALRRKAAARM